MSSHLVSSGLGLVALAWGAFLLAKANKDLLSWFYKAISYFIIIGAFLILICSALQGAMKFYGRKYHFKKMMMQEGQGMHGFHSNMRNYHYYHGYGRNCCMEECCRMGETSPDQGKEHLMGMMKDSCMMRMEKNK